MMKRSNDLKRVGYIILLLILSFVLFKAFSNSKETQQKGYFVNVNPIEFYVTNTRYHSVVFTFKYQSKIHERTISYKDYKRIKKNKKVRMFYFENSERVSFDLNTVPNKNAKFGFWDYLLVFLPLIGVFYNLCLLKIKVSK